jgi:uncharacterized protein YeaO (DUF488 family)
MKMENEQDKSIAPKTELVETVPVETKQKTRKPNKWIAFVKQFKQKHPELKQYREVLRLAAIEYKK